MGLEEKLSAAPHHPTRTGAGGALKQDSGGSFGTKRKPLDNLFAFKETFSNFRNVPFEKRLERAVIASYFVR